MSTVQQRRYALKAISTRLGTDPPHVNPNTGTKEFALRDPDGYYVMVSALDAA